MPIRGDVDDILCKYGMTLLADNALPEAWQLPYEEYSDTFILNPFSNFLSLQKAVENIPFTPFSLWQTTAR